MSYHPQKAMRVALITGAAKRIGAAIAEYLHQAGYRVAIHCYQSRDAADALCLRLNQQRADSAKVFQADLTQKAINQALPSQVIQWAGQLDILVNNASIFVKTQWEAPDDAQWAALFITNVQAPYWLSLAAREALVKQKGAIVNITDVYAEIPWKDYAEYCQTKAALQMQTKVLAQEFAPDIRVNAVAPGSIAWPEHDNALSATQKKQVIERAWLKRHGDPIYIAQAVFMLAENEFITGQILRVDGGR